MKKNLLFAIWVTICGLVFSSFALAQDNRAISAVTDTYVISAKAGGVNYVEGKVSIIRKDGKSGFLLKDDSVEIGDKISTDVDGKAEILLNPGSFVRLGGNSQFEFITTDLDNLKLKLSAGTGIFEVYAADEFKVTIDLPGADIELTKSGVYRVDVLSDGSGKVAVWKGKVVIDQENELKAGRLAIFKGKSASEVAKFDRDNKDALDIWSQLRAKEAVKINQRLQRNTLSNSLLSSYNRGGWNMFGTFGVWVFDPFTRRWCFLPFGAGWLSPYGYGYGFDMTSCRLPFYVYYPPPMPNTTTTTTTTTTTNPNTGQMTPAQAQIREERRSNAQTPTFLRMENSQREERGGGSRNDSGNSDSGGWGNTRQRNDSDSRPTFTPSMPSTQPSNPAPSTPIIVPSRSETKDNSIKDN